MQLGGMSKFQKKFLGPFTIVKRIGKVAYQLNLPDFYAKASGVSRLLAAKRQAARR